MSQRRLPHFAIFDEPYVIFIVRHGETNENRQGIVQGQLDTKLNENGVYQARLVAQALKGVPFTEAYSSDLERAVKTAEAILEEHPGVTLHQDPALRERYMGALQGAPLPLKRDIKAGKEPNDTIEKSEDFSERTLNWWEKTVGDPYPSWWGRCVLVVSHGAFIATLVQSLMIWGVLRPPHEGIKLGRCHNTSITCLWRDQTHARWDMFAYADITHLTGVEQSVVQKNADALEGDEEQRGRQGTTK